jgi:hypothetical protein
MLVWLWDEKQFSLSKACTVDPSTHTGLAAQSHHISGFSKFKHNLVYPVLGYEKITADVYDALLPIVECFLCCSLFRV